MKNEWIPVKERLPETDYELWSDPVLVTRKAYYPNGEKWYKVEKAVYCEELLSSDKKYRDTPGWRIGKNNYSTDCIVAWMPLPEPYTEEELPADPWDGEKPHAPDGFVAKYCEPYMEEKYG